MRTLFGLRALRGGGASAVTIGTFDGVHLGHRALIERTKGFAKRAGVRGVAVTWDRHPNETLRPDRVPPLLTSLRRKLELLQEYGLDATSVLSFDDRLSHWLPARFVDEVLVEGLEARAVFVGEGWRFGHRASGDAELLRKIGEKRGFVTEVVPLREHGDEPVSSSRVREAVSEGDVELAAKLLGRPFDYEGVVSRGDDRGARIGFPTANVVLDPTLATPRRGVYACRASTQGLVYAAAVNVGVNPTFEGSEETTLPRIEAHLLDYSGELYGHTLRIVFLRRLRDELRFESVGALVAQIKRDVEETRGLAAL